MVLGNHTNWVIFPSSRCLHFARPGWSWSNYEMMRCPLEGQCKSSCNFRQSFKQWMKLYLLGSETMWHDSSRIFTYSALPTLLKHLFESWSYSLFSTLSAWENIMSFIVLAPDICLSCWSSMWAEHILLRLWANFSCILHTSFSFQRGKSWIVRISYTTIYIVLRSVIVGTMSRWSSIL